VTILGIGDGPASGAALVVDGVIACVEAEPGATGLPYRAIDAVLADAGVAPDEVDVVALAGRFSPPLVVRRFPGLEELSGTVAVRGAAAAWQTTLRATGFGAVQADIAATWLGDQLRPRGFRPRRVQTVDVHTCLASAAYRCQDRDDALVVTVQPHGDGLLAAVHRGLAGQLDRVWDQRAPSSLHTHLDRCARLLHVDRTAPLAALELTAGDAAPDPELAAHVGPTCADGELGGGLTSDAAGRLAAAARDVAAATVLAALRTAVTGLVAHHVADGSAVSVGGAWAADPRTLALLLGRIPATHIACGPEVGGAFAALGAALFEAGCPPRRVAATLGPRPTDVTVRSALAGRSAEPVDVARVVGALGGGGAIGRIAGRGGHGALGTRSILVRTGDERALARARVVSGRALPCRLVPSCPPALSRLASAVDHGMAFEEGRIRRVDPNDDPELHAVAAAVPLSAVPLSDDLPAALDHVHEGRLDGALVRSFQVFAA
jgi:predicted NodU family carbamoyl transferase